MIKTIRYFFSHYGKNSTDYNDNLQENFKLLSRMSLIAQGIYIFRYYSLGANTYALFCVKAALLILLSIYISKFKGAMVLATNLLMFSSYYCMGIGAFYNGGDLSPSVYWLPLMVGLSGYFLDLKYSILWTIIINITLFILIKPELFGIHISSELTFNQLQNARAISNFSSGIMLFVFLLTYRIFREKSIMEIKEQKNNLVKLNSNLEKSETELKLQLENNLRLIRVLSHDLANPLTVIRLSISRLDPNEASTKRIINAANTMEEIIKSVREMQANASGKNSIRREDVNLQTTVNKVIELFEEKLKEKDVKTSVKIIGENLVVIADQNVLSNQVIANIFSNAIKFSKNGDQIDFMIESSDGCTTISIKDNGIGIPKDILAKMFSFDQKTSRLGTSGEKGTGFGMPLMKSYLDMMECRLEVTSQTIEEYPDSHGTQFKIYFGHTQIIPKL